MKRKFKILIMAISIVAMLFAFSITSSAWSFGDSGSVEEDYWYIYDVHTTKYYGYAFTRRDLSGIEISLDYFGILNDGVIEHLNEEIASGSEVGINLYHSSGWSDPDRNSNNNRFIREEVKLAFEQAYAEFETLLEKEFTQTDLDNAVSEATKDMYTQEQLSEAVAKALEEAGVVSNDGWVMESLPKDIIKIETEYSGYKVLYTQDMNLKFFRFDVQHGVGNIDYKFAFVPSEFQDFVNSITKNSPTYENFKNALIDLNSKVESGEYTDDPVGLYNVFNNTTNDSLYLSEDSFEYFMNFNSSMLTDEDLQDKYDEGKVEGVEEFKSSEEYINALNNKYSTGYAEGIESFKVSKAYTDALDLQYSNGKVAGVKDFKASVEFANSLKAKYNAGVSDGVNTFKESEEYKNALNAEYINGFNEGVSFVNVPTDDVEDDFTVIFAFLGASLLVIAFLVISVKASKKKNKTNYR